MICIDFRQFYPALPRKSPESRIIHAVKPGYPFFYKNPVLPCEIDDITDSRESDIGQKVVLRIASHGKNELPCDPCPAHLLVRISITFLLGVYDGIRCFRDRQHFMVIGDDHSHTEFFSHFDLRTGGYSVVAGNDRVGSILVSFTNQVLIDAITVSDTIRDLDVNICTQFSQTAL